jgi:hypothetical protein
VALLSGYFSERLDSKEDLVRAFYVWCGLHIAYDVDNMYTFKPYENPGMLIMETLRTRKAVCQGYAALFNELCANAGIGSSIVLGYTRQNGHVLNTNHAWIAANTGTGWKLYDPTWAAGIVNNGTFIKKFTNEYYQASPERFIKSHMPFDPIWQCLFHPFTPAEFYSQEPPRKTASGFFNYPDSIALYNTLTKAEKFAQTLRRVDQNGVVNNAISEYRRYLILSLDYERLNRENDLRNALISQYNEAINNYNAGAFLFNDYINYWNRQFKPAKPDQEIRQMLDTCVVLLSKSRTILNSLATDDETLQNNIEMLKGSIRKISETADEQSEFLREYFSTPRALRSNLFKTFKPVEMKW